MVRLEDGAALLTCGGAKGTRTPNPLLAKQVRYQLRHGPRRAGCDYEGESVAWAQRSFSACWSLSFFCTAAAPMAVAMRIRIFFIGDSPFLTEEPAGIGIGGPNRT